MHLLVPAEGKPLELQMPDRLGCDDVYERAIGTGFSWREISTGR
jgi:hypothetical protein